MAIKLGTVNVYVLMKYYPPSVVLLRKGTSEENYTAENPVGGT